MPRSFKDKDRLTKPVEAGYYWFQPTCGPIELVHLVWRDGELYHFNGLPSEWGPDYRYSKHLEAGTWLKIEEPVELSAKRPDDATALLQSLDVSRVNVYSQPEHVVYLVGDDDEFWGRLFELEFGDH